MPQIRREQHQPARGRLHGAADWVVEIRSSMTAIIEPHLVVSPKAGRMVVSRGAILHRGAVPTRILHEERHTIVYKLPWGDPPRLA